MSSPMWSFDANSYQNRQVTYDAVLSHDGVFDCTSMMTA